MSEEEREKRRRYVPKSRAKEGEPAQQQPRGEPPPEDPASSAFRTPQMDTSKYRVPPKPSNRNEKLLIALAIFLAACLVIGLIVRLVSGPQSPRLTPTPTPVITQAPPTGAPTPLVTPSPEITPEPTVFTLIKEGSEGEDVARVQQRLIELGYLRGEADGKYGRATNLAVQSFQKAAGLDVDGMTGEKTADALFADNAPHAPEPTASLAPEASQTPTDAPDAEATLPVTEP